MEKDQNTLSERRSEDFEPPISEGDKLSTEIAQRDYWEFIGKNAERYLKRFSKFYANGQDKFAFTWHWPAFFLGAIWMAYRKLYGLALVTIFLGLIPFLGLLVFPAVGFTAHYLYYKHTTKKILNLKASKPFSDPGWLSPNLHKIGGVNMDAAIVVSILVIAIQVAFQVVVRAK